MAANSDRHQSRADQVADGFRAMILLVVSALIGFNLDKLTGDSPISAEAILPTQVAGLVALFLLGTSWTLQKSKALARARLASRTIDEQKPPLWLENWIYDLVAFASLLFAVTLLVVGERVCAMAIAALTAVLFVFVAALLRCCVAHWEKSHNLSAPQQTEK